MRGGAEECGNLTLKPWLWWGGLSGWVCPAAICRNGPRLRKPWRSGIKVCVCVCAASASTCACVVQWQQGSCTLSTGLVVVVRVFGNESG